MLQHKVEEFERLSTNLRLIDAYNELLIIKFSLNTSRVMRYSPCCDHLLLKELDNLQRSNICHIANVDLSDIQWIQASLPVKVGGLGIRRASSLHHSFFWLHIAVLLLFKISFSCAPLVLSDRITISTL